MDAVDAAWTLRGFYMDATHGRYMDACGRLWIPHGRYVGRCVGAMDSTWTLRGRYVDAMGAMDAMDATWAPTVRNP